MQGRSRSASFLPRFVKSPREMTDKSGSSGNNIDSIKEKDENKKDLKITLPNISPATIFKDIKLDINMINNPNPEIEFREQMLKYIEKLKAAKKEQESQKESTESATSSQQPNNNNKNENETKEESDTKSNNNNSNNNDTVTENNNNSKISTIELNNNNNNNNDNDLLEIICLFNGHSGGGKAWLFCNEFKKYTNVTIVDMYDLNKNELLQIEISRKIELCSFNDNLIITICGGDGGCSWAINTLIDKCLNKCDKLCKYPTICCIPCGTGNDLSRVLGWGFVQIKNRKESFYYYRDIHFAAKIAKRYWMLDRWSVNFTFPNDINKYKENNNKDNNNKECQNMTDDEINNIIFKQKREKYHPALPLSFVSYLSFGFDAMIQYQYEQERSKKRSRFTSQNKNKLMLIKHGFSEFFIQSQPINNKIKLYVDDKQVQLIKNCRSCKVVNIKSAVGGVDFWGQRKSSNGELQHWTMPQLGDGKIEVMATRGVHSLMAHGANIAHAYRIAQTANIKLEVIETPIALQIDGESWLIEEPITLNIKLRDQIPFLAGCVNAPLGIGIDKIEKKLYVNERRFLKHRLREIYNMNTSNDDNDEFNNNDNITMDEKNNGDSSENEFSPAISNANININININTNTNTNTNTNSNTNGNHSLHAKSMETTGMINFNGNNNNNNNKNSNDDMNDTGNSEEDTILSTQSTPAIMTIATNNNNNDSNSNKENEKENKDDRIINGGSSKTENNVKIENSQNIEKNNNKTIKLTDLFGHNRSLSTMSLKTLLSTKK